MILNLSKREAEFLAVVMNPNDDAIHMSWANVCGGGNEIHDWEDGDYDKWNDAFREAPGLLHSIQAKTRRLLEGS